MPKPFDRRFSMKRLIAAAVLLSAITGSGASHALPLLPPAQAPNADIIAVAGGCGGGFHRGPYGGCRQNYANPAAHACPRGYHIGPGGGCRGDGR
jgi:hypothetical protein